ncbi:MAG TPA: hypothetical protein VF649_12515 [Sphingomonas sp.]|jgi:hypothetical protein|uniref:hypothetical protein n=1 Tax=Sphingomonas sp. TaxID=28214 RepID=UPI002ED82A79
MAEAPGGRRAETPSPVDLPGAERRPALAHAAGTILTASLFLLLTNAQALDGWAAEQEPSETMVRVTNATEDLLAVTERMGAAAPRAWLHRVWKRAQALRFAGQAPADEAM